MPTKVSGKGSNGLTLDRQGRLLACEHGNRRVSRHESDGSVTWDDAKEGRVRFGSVQPGYDPSEWHVVSGENLGNGYMTLFVTNKHGAPKMVNIDARVVAKRMQETYGNKPEHADSSIGLSNKNAWGWSY